ncbi:MAG: Hint domain-containing protein [Rhodobacteraceae bacterium]|nr:Hint domain-containing protein [Paracoccaceae bacterium]
MPDTALNSTGHTPTPSEGAHAISLAMYKDARLYDFALREDGLLPDSLIATNTGWRPVHAIEPGDMIMTFDSGMQPLVNNHCLTLSLDTVPSHKRFLMDVPAGALGNRNPMRLLPCQEVIIESDMAEDHFGDPFVLIQALMLEGFNGVRRQPIAQDLTIHMLTFAQEQVIHCSGATLVSARAESDFSPLWSAAMATAPGQPRLSFGQLRRVADALNGAATGHTAKAALPV